VVVAGGREDRLRRPRGEVGVALRLVPAGGRQEPDSRPAQRRERVRLVARRSPIAIETGTGTLSKLAVVDVATGQARRLLQLNYAPTRGLVARFQRAAREHGPEEPEVLVDLGAYRGRLEPDPDLELSLAVGPRRDAAQGFDPLRSAVAAFAKRIRGRPRSAPPSRR